MNAPPTFLGTIWNSRLGRSRWLMRTVFSLLIACGLLLSFFPERYRAAVTLTPTDPVSMGLSGTLGQLGALNSVFGNQAAVEVALKVGRSQQVREIAIKELQLARRLNISDPVKLHRWVQDHVEIRSLRGGIIQFEMRDRDANLAQAIVAQFAQATQERLAQISRRQTQYKRDVLLKLVGDASSRLSVAKGNFDRFRLTNRAVLPDVALANASSSTLR